MAGWEIHCEWRFLAGNIIYKWEIFCSQLSKQNYRFEIRATLRCSWSFCFCVALGNHFDVTVLQSGDVARLYNTRKSNCSSNQLVFFHASAEILFRLGSGSQTVEVRNLESTSPALLGTFICAMVKRWYLGCGNLPSWVGFPDWWITINPCSHGVLTIPELMGNYYSPTFDCRCFWLLDAAYISHQDQWGTSQSSWFLTLCGTKNIWSHHSHPFTSQVTENDQVSGSTDFPCLRVWCCAGLIGARKPSLERLGVDTGGEPSPISGIPKWLRDPKWSSKRVMFHGETMGKPMVWCGLVLS